MEGIIINVKNVVKINLQIMVYVIGFYNVVLLFLIKMCGFDFEISVKKLKLNLIVNGIRLSMVVIVVNKIGCRCVVLFWIIVFFILDG